MIGLSPDLQSLADRMRALTPQQQDEAIARMAPSQRHAILAAIAAQPLLKAMMGATWQPHKKQVQARALIDDPEIVHVLLYGGSRSGKSQLAVRTLFERAIQASGSRHLIARFRFNAARTSLWHDTIPKTLTTCFPGLEATANGTEFFYKLSNGSEVWVTGLDSEERTERILGTEYSSAFIDECSQVSWASAEIVHSRVAQKCGLPLKILYAENPPLVTHWSYRLFVQKRAAETPHKLIDNPQRWAAIQVNPEDNKDNLEAVYLEGLRSGSARQKLRFYDGRFGDAGEAALWTLELIERNRVKKAPGQFQKIGVAIDPSGTKGGDGRDHVGIVVGGLALDGHCYLLEDASVQAPPAVWGRVVMNCVERYDAEFVCIETNFGGEMAVAVIQAAAADVGRRVPIHEVTASRGKVIRAEPVATLYEQNRVHHVGSFTELEDQLVSFSTTGYLGSGSPDRADAAIWLVSDFFPRVMREARDAAEGNAGAARRRRDRPQFANVGYESAKMRHRRLGGRIDDRR